LLSSYLSPDEIPDPQELDRNIRNLIVFDDVMTEKKQTPAENYYTRSRSANCDCIYLSQNFTILPLYTIRSNSNFMIFFKSSPIVVEQLYRNFASVDMDIKHFKDFCKKAWSKKHGYIVIDLSRDYESDNKYRSNLELNNN
jgi:ASC-1-like (ASCH) protein